MVMAFVVPAVGVLLGSMRVIISATGTTSVWLTLVEVETVAVWQTALSLVTV